MTYFMYILKSVIRGRFHVSKKGCIHNSLTAQSIHLRKKNIAGPTERSAMYLYNLNMIAKSLNTTFAAPAL